MRRSTGLQRTKRASRPADKPRMNRLSTDDFVTAFGVHGISLVRASRKTFRRRVFDSLQGTRDPCLLGEQLCWQTVLPDPAPPPRRAPRPDPLVVCPDFGIDMLWMTMTMFMSRSMSMSNSMSMQCQRQYHDPNDVFINANDSMMTLSITMPITMLISMLITMSRQRQWICHVTPVQISIPFTISMSIVHVCTNKKNKAKSSPITGNALHEKGL